MRRCTGCGIEGGRETFYKQTQHPDGLTSRCKKCTSLDRKAYYVQNQERIKQRERRARKEYKVKKRDSVLRKTYGIDTKEYERISAEQQNKCAICGDSRHAQRYEKLVIDHDHRTGKMRGLLCHRCNRAIGLLGDSTENLSRAVSYLRRFDEGSYPPNAG